MIAVGRAENARGRGDFVVRTYAAISGDLLWGDLFDLARRDDEAYAVAIKGKQAFVAGRGTNAASNADFLVRAYAVRDGALLWQDQFDLAAGDDEAVALAAMGKQVFVAGTGTSSEGDSDLLVRVYDDR